MANNWGLTELATSVNDKEGKINALIASVIKGVGATLAVVFPSDANYTPTAATVTEAFHLTVTGTLTATRNLVLPKIQKEWVVRNGTGQSIVAIGSTGTGVTITAGNYKRVLFDGTNFVDVS